jgi:hypothetical protein
MSFSFFLVSGNTPIAVWGTHLDLIQNPQIRAKHGGKEHINVSLGLAGPVEAATQLVASSKGGASLVLMQNPAHSWIILGGWDRGANTRAF